jgi:transcriptional regulator with XRE-family HTH domain
MATTLAPVDSREVLRCDRCSLVQFRTSTNLCRRCHTSLDPDEPEPILAEPPPAPTNGHGNGHGNALQVALAIRNLRQRVGMSQRQLALRMQVPRTYVSKIENEKACPTLSSIERLAKALEVSVPELLVYDPGGQNLQSDIRDLISDDFISQLLPYLSKLDGMQWSSILAQVRDLSLRPRRNS